MLLASIIRHRVLANVILAVILLVGTVAYFKIVREFFPEFSVDVIMVSVIHPGADPEETEEGISRKIEEAIDSIEGIKKYQTISGEGFSRALIEVQPGYELDVVKERVKTQVDSITNLPDDAEKPIITDIAIEALVMRIALWGDLDERTLKEWAEHLKDEMLELDGISRIDIIGTREYEISIELSEERLRQFNLTFAQVSDVVRASSLNLAGGTIRTTGEQIRLRTLGRKYTGEEFAKIVIVARPNGESITLDKVATIRDGFTQDNVVSTFNGKPAAMIVVKKVRTEDAIAIAETMHQFVKSRQETLPEGVHITAWSDLSILIQDRISLLMRNGMIGLCLVFVMLWLFLDLRLSFWVAMGIPISFTGAIALMWIYGATINMMSLFSLILVLGIIVDDAIVVGEAIYVHRKNGEGPLMAAVAGVREVGLPVIAAVTTTIIAFLPLAFVPGVLGKFVAILPVVVVSALMISVVECLFLLPAHLNHLPDLSIEARKTGGLGAPMRRVRRYLSDGLETFAERVYMPFVEKAIAWRYITLSVACLIVMFVFGLGAGGFIRFDVFPTSDGDIVIGEVEFPAGTPTPVVQEALVQTRAGLQRLQDKIKTPTGEPLVRQTYTVAGQTRGGNDPSGGARAMPHYGFIEVELLGSEERAIHYEELNRMWAEEVGVIPGAIAQNFRVEEQGPPGSPIDIGIRGPNLDDLITVRDMVKAKLETYGGVYQIDDNYRLGNNELQFQLKPEGRTLGLTVADLARQVYAGYFGEEAVRLQRGRDDVRVRVRYTAAERSRFADIEDVRVRTPMGSEVPLFSVADVVYTKGPSTITRSDGLRQISVTSEVDTNKITAGEVLADLNANFFPDLKRRYPAISYRFEGPQTDSRDAFGGLAIGFPIALLGMFVVIATIFRSYVQPLVIMVTVPFGLIGAILAHLAMGYMVTMMSIFGMVALAGVVVNDAIVLIERINSYIAEGMPVFEALKRGGARRFRAIFLTTVSTCGGLSPLILEKSMQAQFLIPMALSMAGGVAFATLLTLVLIPALLGILNDMRRISHHAFTGHWPTPEEVEPARLRGFSHEDLYGNKSIDQPALSPSDPETVVAK